MHPWRGYGELLSFGTARSHRPSFFLTFKYTYPKSSLTQHPTEGASLMYTCVKGVILGCGMRRSTTKIFDTAENGTGEPSECPGT